MLLNYGEQRPLNSNLIWASSDASEAEWLLDVNQVFEDVLKSFSFILWHQISVLGQLCPVPQKSIFTCQHHLFLVSVDSPNPIQEKRYQSLENERQLQQLTFVREEKRQLGNELEAVHSKDKQLRERIGQLEAILHKVELIYFLF